MNQFPRKSNGFSGRGGPVIPKRDTSGSSSGGGVAMAVGLAAVSLDSEMDSYIVSPSNKNSVVGVKSTTGLVSRTKGKLEEGKYCEDAW